MREENFEKSEHDIIDIATETRDFREKSEHDIFDIATETQDIREELANGFRCREIKDTKRQ